MNLAIASMIAVMRERGFSEPDILAVVEAAVSTEKPITQGRQSDRERRLRQREARLAKKEERLGRNGA